MMMLNSDHKAVHSSPSLSQYRNHRSDASTVPSISTVSCPLLTMLIIYAVVSLMLAQSGADAFLLSHRNLLVPFASTRMATNLGPANDAVQESAADEPAIDNHDEAGSEPGFELQSDASAPHYHLAGFLLVPRRVPDSAADAPAEEDLHPMTKRMHHLSILRKIGSPGNSGAASRLFGPQRQRELKRHAPLWLINY